jgi:hypothetical protein
MAKNKIYNNVVSPKLYEAVIKLNINGQLHRFKIIHNLPNVFGVSINDALDCWIHRTKNYSARSFCEYILSKDSSLVAMTESQFKRLNKK